MGNALYVERCGAPPVSPGAAGSTGRPGGGGGGARALHTAPAAPRQAGGPALLRLYEVRAGSAGARPEPLAPWAGGAPGEGGREQGAQAHAARGARGAQGAQAWWLRPTSAFVAVVVRADALGARTDGYGGAPAHDETATSAAWVPDTAAALAALTPRGMERCFVGRTVVAASAAGEGGSAPLALADPAAPRADYRVYVLSGVASSPVARALALTAALQIERELLAEDSICARLLEGHAGELQLCRLPEAARSELQALVGDAQSDAGVGKDAAQDMDTDSGAEAGTALPPQQQPHAPNGEAVAMEEEPPPAQAAQSKLPALSLRLGGLPAAAPAPAAATGEGMDEDGKLAPANGGGAAATAPGAAALATAAGASPTSSPLVANRPPQLSLSFNGRGGPSALDLGSVGRGGAEKTEAMRKREKMAKFANHCSEVAPGLFVSGEAIARDRAALDAAGVTHVVNCVGFVCDECHAPDLTYLTLWLQDSPEEDISSLFYDVFDFIRGAHAQGGRVLIHCTHGVSRSASFAIAYEMHRTGGSYEDVFRALKERRGVINPNVGFACQLLQWGGRRKGREQKSAERARVLGIWSHSQHDPLRLVPKSASGARLDRRGAFVVLPHDEISVFVWLGEVCPPQLAAAAALAAEHLTQYEGLPAAQEVAQGDEPMALREALRSWARRPDTADGDQGDLDHCEEEAWSDDYALFAAALSRGTQAMPGRGGGAGAPPPEEVPLYGMLAQRQRSAGNATAAQVAHAAAAVDRARSEGGASLPLARTMSEGSVLCESAAHGQSSALHSAPPPPSLNVHLPGAGAGARDGNHAPSPTPARGGAQAEDCADPAPSEDGGASSSRPRLFMHADMEELEMFDGEDLEPSGVFLLYCPEGGDEDQGGDTDTRPLCAMWVGDEVDEDDVPAPHEAAEALAGRAGLATPPRVLCVEHNDEPDWFWEIIDSM